MQSMVKLLPWLPQKHAFPPSGIHHHPVRLKTPKLNNTRNRYLHADTR